MSSSLSMFYTTVLPDPKLHHVNERNKSVISPTPTQKSSSYFNQWASLTGGDTTVWLVYCFGGPSFAGELGESSVLALLNNREEEDGDGVDCIGFVTFLSKVFATGLSTTFSQVDYSQSAHHVGCTSTKRAGWECILMLLCQSAVHWMCLVLSSLSSTWLSYLL